MSTSTVTCASPRQRALRRAPVRWPWLLVAFAWGVALLATITGRRELIDHHYLLEDSGLAWPTAVAVFLACWQVMAVAMMLPSSLPMVNLMTYVARRQGRRLSIPAAFLAGYALVWTGFAALAFVGDTGIHHLVDVSPWLAPYTVFIGAATLALAGAFQFTSLKERCLAACHSSLDFFAHTARAGRVSAWQVGLRHGLSCLGSCWALMLVMFGVGVGSLAWMGLLTGIMLIEKTSRHGKLFVPVVGALLLLWGGATLLHLT